MPSKFLATVVVEPAEAMTSWQGGEEWPLTAPKHTWWAPAPTGMLTGALSLATPSTVIAEARKGEVVTAGAPVQRPRRGGDHDLVGHVGQDGGRDTPEAHRAGRSQVGPRDPHDAPPRPAPTGG